MRKQFFRRYDGIHGLALTYAITGADYDAIAANNNEADKDPQNLNKWEPITRAAAIKSAYAHAKLDRHEPQTVHGDSLIFPARVRCTDNKREPALIESRVVEEVR